MHELMLNLCEKHQIEVPILTLFNEIYYQCVRVHYDGNPGKGLLKRYLIEERVWLQSELAAELVFCMVWALYQRREYPDYKEEMFRQRITPLISDSVFMDAANGFVHYMQENNLFSISVFSTKPIPISQIPKRIDLDYHTSMTLKEKIFRFFSLPVESSARDFNPWRNVTNDYSCKVIHFYITLYKDRDSQMALLERIKSACTKEEYMVHKDCFEKLESQILRGNYVPLSGCYYDEEVDYDTLKTDAQIRCRNLDCGEGSEVDPVEEYETATSSAMAVSAGQLIENFDEEQLRNPRIRSLIGGLLAAMAYSTYDVFISYAASDPQGKHITDFLERTLLKIEVDNQSGKITTTSEITSRSRVKPSSSETTMPADKDDTVIIEPREGKTVYVIQNLNINLTAEVIHQLNVSPQEVINHYHDLINEEIKKLGGKVNNA